MEIYMENRYVEITKAEAKTVYCNCERVCISTDARELWKLPASYEYGSHAPVEELFYRSIPEHEGKVRFFKIDKRKKGDSL